MKATGIVRRIDDLGRVVIPKEIRRTMRIREGDPLEIFTGAGGDVIFKKYSPIGELTEFASQYAEALAQGTKFPIIICDRDHCVAAAGISKKEVLHKAVTPELEEIMVRRQQANYENENSPSALEGLKQGICIASPIINSGDICGAVVLLWDELHSPVKEADIKLATVAADFLGRQME